VCDSGFAFPDRELLAKFGAISGSVSAAADGRPRQFGSYTGREGSPLWKLGMVDQGTGSTFSALGDRGLLSVQWHRIHTCIARASRTCACPRRGASSPEPARA
jgi:hypothetical protein